MYAALSCSEYMEALLFYLFGSGGFGGGLVSHRMLSVLCDVRFIIVCVWARMSRSRGVNGISGNDVRCDAQSFTGYCSVLHIVDNFT